MAWDGLDRVEARQRLGEARWVVPGQTDLPVRVFGTPERPQHTGGLPAGVSPTVRELIEAVPYLIGVPLEDRSAGEGGDRWTRTRGATPFGDEELPIRGRLVLEAQDRRWEDRLPPLDTPDELRARARFTDPAGNRYEVRLKQTIQPDLPGWQTGGGVLREVQLDPGVGGRSPLEPPIFAHLVAWGIADVAVDGEWVERDRLVRLIASGGPGQRGDLSETSLLLWPVRVTPDGLVHAPLELPATSPDGSPQRWVHVRFPETRWVHVDRTSWVER